MRRIIPYFVTLLTFVALDAVWLTLTTSIYRNQLADILIPEVRLLPSISYYLLQVLGIQIFVLPRARGVASAFAFGASFGIFTYATYDLTNWAVLKDWTYSITLMDVTWGAVVTGSASIAGYLAVKRFGK